MIINIYNEPGSELTIKLDPQFSDAKTLFNIEKLIIEWSESSDLNSPTKIELHGTETF